MLTTHTFEIVILNLVITNLSEEFSFWEEDFIYSLILIISHFKTLK